MTATEQGFHERLLAIESRLMPAAEELRDEAAPATKQQKLVNAYHEGLPIDWMMVELYGESSPENLHRLRALAAHVVDAGFSLVIFRDECREWTQEHLESQRMVE